MSNRKLLAWTMFIAILVWVGSCKPKDGAVNPETEDSTLIIARSCITLEEKINDVLYRTYEYDTLRRLTRVLEYSADARLNRLVKRYTFDYDAKDTTKIVRLHETNLAVRDQSYIYNLEYDTDNGGIKYILPYKVYNSGPRPIDTISVFYDSEKRINEMQAASIFHYIWDYDSAGNVQKWSIRRPELPTDSLLAEYTEYDDKINMYLYSKGVQLLNLLHGSPSSRHNPTKYNILGQDVNVSYNYNAKGIPIQAVGGYKVMGDTTTTTQTRTYTLDCK